MIGTIKDISHKRLRAAREVLTRGLQPLAIDLPDYQKHWFESIVVPRQRDTPVSPGLYLPHLPKPMAAPVYSMLLNTGVYATRDEKESRVYVEQKNLPKNGIAKDFASFVHRYLDSDDRQSPLTARPDIFESLQRLDRLVRTKIARPYDPWRVRITLSGAPMLNFRLSIGRLDNPDFKKHGAELIALHAKHKIKTEIRGKGAYSFLIIYGKETIARIADVLPPMPEIYLPSPPHHPQKLLTHAHS